MEIEIRRRHGKIRVSEKYCNKKDCCLFGNGLYRKPGKLSNNGSKREISDTVR